MILKTRSKSIVRRVLISLFSILLLVNVILAGSFMTGKTALASAENTVIKISGTKNYSYAFQVLALVNEERAAEGLSPLTLDKNMTEQAMERAAQVTVYFDHGRPTGGSGTDTLTALMKEYPSAFGSSAGENIAINQSSPSAVMNSWMNSSGHKANILNSKYTTIGIGYFEGGWVQVFGAGSATTFSQPGNKTSTYSIEINESVCPITLSLNSSTAVTLDAGETISRTVRITNPEFTYMKVPITNAVWSSSNTSVATVSNGTVTAVAPGSAVITASVGSKSISFNVNVPVRPTAVNISKTAMSINIGKVDQLSATVVPDGTGIGITWASSDTSVAQVSSDGYVTANGIGTCTITASAGSYASATCKVTVLSPATAIDVTPASIDLEKGGTYQLSAALTPSNSTDKTTWKSSDSSVASVDNTGKVTAAGAGSAVITATTDSGKTDTVAVNVTAPCTGIAINNGDTVRNLADGSFTVTSQAAPSDCTDKITWSVDNSNVVSIAANGSSCKVTPNTTGTAVLTVSCGEYSDSVTVTIHNPVTAIEIPSAASVIKGGKTRLSANITPADTDSVPVWASSDPSVATVDQDGVVTAISAGETAVSISADGITAQCTVTVYEPAVTATGITLSVNSTSIIKGEKEKLTCSFTPDGSEAAVTWTSSNEDVAVVDVDGTVTALSDGEAVITASIDGASDSCTVTAYTPVIYIESFKFSKSSVTLNLNSTADLSVTPGYAITPANWRETINWTSSNSSVVSVSNGKITAKACGSAVITAASRNCSASITVNVVNPCTGISLSSSSATLLNGEKITLTANVTPSNTSDSISWSSSNTSALKLVSSSGNQAVFSAAKTGTYTVTAVCGNYSAKCTVTVNTNPAHAPGVPDVSVEVLGIATLKVNWTAAENCAGYELERSSSADSKWYKLADVSSSSTLSNRNINLTFNRTYNYRVRGYKINSNGTRSYGSWSKIVSAKPLPVLSGLTAKNTTYNSVTVSWTKLSTANGYYVYRSTNDGSTWSLVKTITKNSTVSWKNSSLTPGRTYLYKVVPYRKSGKTKVKGIDSIVSVQVVPPKPSSVSVSVSSSIPTLSWAKVTGAQGYEIWRSNTYDGTYTQIATITSGTTVKWKDVATAANRYYKVRAYRGTDYGTAYSDFSAAVTATTNLGKPTAFASSASYSSIKVSWHKVTGAAGYKVYRSTDGKSFSLVKTITSGSTLSWTNAGLSGGTTYYYYVIPYTSSMTGKASDTVSAVPTLSAPSLTVSSYSYYLKLSWKKVSGAAGYNIYRSLDGENFTLIKNITSGSTVAWSDTSVVKGLPYSYKIAAVRNGKEGKISSVKSSSPTISAPTSVKASRASYESIKITWKKASGATGYDILRSTSKNGTYTVVGSVSGNGTVAYTDTGLDTGKTFYYKVRSVRTLSGFTGYSLNSSYASAKTTLGTPSIKASNAGYNSIKVSWSAISGSEGYVIYRSTSKNGTYKEIARVNGSTLSYTDSGLSTNKYYYYKVKALHNNTSGAVYSSASTYKSAKTQLKAPTNMKFDYSPEYVGVFWTADSEATGYQVYRSTKKTSGYTKQCSYADSSFVEYKNGDKIELNTPYKFGSTRFIYFTNVSASKTYYYKVRAFRSAGTSSYYSSYCAYKAAKTVVQTPSIKYMESFNDGTSAIAFLDATAAHDYAVYRATSKSGTYTNVTSQCDWYYDEESDLNIFVAPTPTDGKTYYFKIRGIHYGSKKTYYSSYSSIKSIVA